MGKIFRKTVLCSFFLCFLCLNNSSNIFYKNSLLDGRIVFPKGSSDLSMPFTAPVSNEPCCKIYLPWVQNENLTKLVFEGSGSDGLSDLYVINDDGSNLINITNTIGINESDPIWSSDGMYIAFYSGNSKLAVVKADGTGYTIFSDEAVGGFQWVGENHTVAFMTYFFRLGTPYYSAINFHRINIDKTGYQQTGAFTMGTIAYTSFVWSPETNYLIANYDSNIYRINNAGGNFVQLTSSNSVDASFCRPNWSKDSTKIVFCQSAGYRNTDIYLVNADGSNSTVLTNESIAENTPKFSPNGNQIAFLENNYSGRISLVVDNHDGSGRKQLTDQGLIVNEFSWHNSGKKIAFSAKDAVSEKWHIYTIDVDGSNLRKVFEIDGGFRKFSYQP